MLKRLTLATMLSTLIASAAVAPNVMTPRRTGAIAAILIALTGAVMGARTLARTPGDRRRSAVLALALGSLGLLGGGLVVTTAPGGLGTGNGLGGGVVAMVLGLVGAALGVLALARLRRVA